MDEIIKKTKLARGMTALLLLVTSILTFIEPTIILWILLTVQVCLILWQTKIIKLNEGANNRTKPPLSTRESGREG